MDKFQCPYGLPYGITKNPNFKELQERIKEICEIYINSEKLEQEDTVVLCTDEKTGIQAKEHAHPTKNVQPGSVEKVETEYIRHGTTTLIATPLSGYQRGIGKVITGQIVQYTLQKKTLPGYWIRV